MNLRKAIEDTRGRTTWQYLMEDGIINDFILLQFANPFPGHSHQTPQSYFLNIYLPKEDLYWPVHKMGLLHTQEIQSKPHPHAHFSLFPHPQSRHVNWSQLKRDHFEVLAKDLSDTHSKIKETLLFRELKPSLHDNVSCEKLYLYQQFFSQLLSLLLLITYLKFSCYSYSKRSLLKIYGETYETPS